MLVVGPTIFEVKALPRVDASFVFISSRFYFSLLLSAREAMLASDMCSCYAVVLAACNSSEVPEKFKFEFTPNELEQVALDS